MKEEAAAGNQPYLLIHTAFMTQVCILTMDLLSF